MTLNKIIITVMLTCFIISLTKKKKIINIEIKSFLISCKKKSFYQLL